jgi:hypothetical protein
MLIFGDILYAWIQYITASLDEFTDHASLFLLYPSSGFTETTTILQ